MRCNLNWSRRWARPLPLARRGRQKRRFIPPSPANASRRRWTRSIGDGICASRSYLRARSINWPRRGTPFLSKSARIPSCCRPSKALPKAKTPPKGSLSRQRRSLRCGAGRTRKRHWPKGWDGFTAWERRLIGRAFMTPAAGIIAASLCRLIPGSANIFGQMTPGCTRRRPGAAQRLVGSGARSRASPWEVKRDAAMSPGVRKSRGKLRNSYKPAARRFILSRRASRRRASGKANSRWPISPTWPITAWERQSCCRRQPSSK